MADVCPKEGIPLRTIALNHGISDMTETNRFIQGFQSQKVHMSFREYLKSQGISSVISPKSQVQDFPHRNIGTRSSHRGIKRFTKVGGRHKNALRHMRGRTNTSHRSTSTTHREGGGAISGVGGTVVHHANPISANSASENSEFSVTPAETDKSNMHCMIGIPIEIEQGDSIEGTLAILKRGMLAIVVSGSRTFSSLLTEHVALTINYVIEAYKLFEEKKTHTKTEESLKALLNQVNKWRSRYYCTALKAGGYDKDETKALFRLFEDYIREHLMLVKQFADATFKNDTESGERAEVQLLGDNLISICENLANITGPSDKYDERMDKIQRLWKEHISCTIEYVDARQAGMEDFNDSATKCLNQASKLGHIIDIFARDGSADLREEHHRHKKQLAIVGECMHEEGESCGKCKGGSPLDVPSEVNEFIGTSLAKRKRAKRYLQKNGTHYRKKNAPHKGKLMKRKYIIVGDNLSPEHMEIADKFGCALVDFTKRIQEEPVGSRMVAHAVLADSIISKCFEECGKNGSIQTEEEVNEKIGTMISGLSAALCSSLEMAAIYQPTEIERGSPMHIEAKAKAERQSYDSSVPLFDEYPGARIAHAELVYSSLHDIKHFPINGVRNEGDDSPESIKKQWMNVAAPLTLLQEYPELKNGTKVPMCTYLGCSSSYQERKKNNPSYHMMPPEVMIQAILTQEEKDEECKRDCPHLKDYRCDEVSESAAQLASLFSADSIDNKDRNIISMEFGYSMLQAFEENKRGQENEEQELRGGRYCSIKGIRSKNFYDSVASLVHNLRSCDFVSNNETLRKKVEAHIQQSYNHIDRLITPKDGNDTDAGGDLGYIREFAQTGKSNSVVVDISKRKKIRQEEQSARPLEIYNLPKIRSLADLSSGSEDEDEDEDESSSFSRVQFTQENMF